MAFLHHRKLVIEAMVNVTEVCRPVCDKAIQTIYCSTQCKLHCPQTCVSYLFSPPPPPPEADTAELDGGGGSHRASTFLSVTIALLAASFLLVCGYALYARYYGAGRRRSRDGAPSSPSSTDGDRITREFLDEEHGATVDHHVWFIRTVGLDPSVIGSITAVRYKKDEGLVEGTDCSVCLSEFQEDESLRLLPKCSHAFHVACIDTWLRSHTNCPMCRAPILVKALSASETVTEGETPVPVISRSVSESGESSRGEDLPAATSEDGLEAGPGPAALDCSDDKEALEVGDAKRVRDEKKLHRLRSGGSSHSNNGRSNSMKRSRSCNGKFVLCRPVRVTDSILPLRSI